jgi:hypothetical protein
MATPRAWRRFAVTLHPVQPHDTVEPAPERVPASTVRGMTAPPPPAPAPQSAPGWVRVLDIVVLTLVFLAVALLIGGRMRLGLGPLRVTIGSVERQLAVAFGLLLVRRVAYGGPGLHRRILDGCAALWAEPAIRSLTYQYWTLRLSILLVGYLAVASFGLVNGGPFRVDENELVNLPARWDAGWYLGIATSGYRPAAADAQQNIAFMPGFPVLMRLGGGVLGVDQERMRTLGNGPDRALLLWSGVIISLLLGWTASVWIVRLASEWTDPDRAVAAAILLQAYPFALFYGAAYTEALFLACSAAALVLFRRASWTTAALCGLLAGVSRPNGFVLSVPLGLLLAQWVWRHRRVEATLPPAGRLAGPVLATIAPVVSMLGFSWLVYEMTGSAFRWTQLHAAWGREYRSVVSLASRYYERFAGEGLYGYTASAPIDALNLAAAIFALCALLPVWRRIGLPYAAFLAAIVVPPLSMGGVLSMGRITATALPAFLWLGAALSPGARRNVMLFFVALQALAAALFYTWRPLF